MKFIPKEVTFSDHFEELAGKIKAGGILFSEILDDYKHSEAKTAQLKEIEREADTIAYGIYQKLHATFLTPLDREDIYALANKMDTILDMIESAATKIQLYNIKELALILNKAIDLMEKVIHAMRKRRKNLDMIREICIEINTLENEGDHVLRKSMVHLFESDIEATELIKWKDIIERVEEAIDVCEDVSNIFEGIILKNG